MRIAAAETIAGLASTDDRVERQALRVTASFDRLARDLAASQANCAAAPEFVGRLLANR